MRKLEVGYDHCHIAVRRESVPGKLPPGLRLLFIADTHFNGWNKRLAERLSGIVAAENPDLVLLGGDYVDTRGGLDSLRKLFRALLPFPTVGIMGNHDRFLGRQRILAADPGRHICWLNDKATALQLAGQTISITNDPAQGQMTGSRILLLHEPIAPHRIPDYFNLVLAGHLHGCQVVLKESNHRLYPGAWFYRNNFTWQSLGPERTYLITRGLADTLPLRYNCPREVIVITC